MWLHREDIFAKIFARRGLHLNAYNAYQSIIRGGHTFLTIRGGIEEVTCFGDRIDLLIPLNQDSMDRHLGLMKSGSAVVHNGDTIKPRGQMHGTAGVTYSAVIRGEFGCLADIGVAGAVYPPQVPSWQLCIIVDS